MRRAAAGRHGLVAQILETALDSLHLAGPTVLDCGGGSGSFAVPLACSSPTVTVTVVDISADALATLHRRAVEAGIAERIRPVQGDVEALSEVVEPATFDLVLAHGILEAFDRLDVAFGHIAGSVRRGGLLSVLVGNPVAAVLARALAGDLAAANRELAALDDHPLGPATVQQLAAARGLRIEQVHGVGVFADLVPGAALDAPGARDDLAALEAACATRPPFTEIAAQVHVLARREG